MIRVIVRTADANMAANVGGPVHVYHRTFDLEAPELEEYLREPNKLEALYIDRAAIGVEVIIAPAPGVA